jgi:hypothetical protein
MPPPFRSTAHFPDFHKAAPVKEPCRVATTGPITIATALNAGDTIDGVTLAAEDRVLVWQQSTASQNGIYGVGATPYRDYDMDDANEVSGVLVSVIEGSTYAGTVFQCTTVALGFTLDTSDIDFQLSGAPSFATPAIVLGTAAAAGAASTVIRSDSTIVAFDATAPTTQAFGDTAATGSAAVAARRDHLHGMPDSPAGAYSETIGDNSNTSFAVTHSLGTQDVVVELWDLTGADPVEATADASSITATDTDTVTVVFGSPPATDAYRVVVLAAGTTQTPYTGRCKAQRTATLSLSSAVTTTVPLSAADIYDGDDMHYTSDANLTGTVTKTATSADLVGSGTAFTSELSVGQMIVVPGTADEPRVVVAITDDTHLTVSGAFANSASGQTAARTSRGVVIRSGMAGLVSVTGHAEFAGNTTGIRRVYPALLRAGSTVEQEVVSYGNNGSSLPGLSTPAQYEAQEWDWIELRVRQDSGVNLNLVGASLAVVSFG